MPRKRKLLSQGASTIVEAHVGDNANVGALVKLPSDMNLTIIRSWTPRTIAASSCREVLPFGDGWAPVAGMWSNELCLPAGIVTSEGASE